MRVMELTLISRSGNGLDELGTPGYGLMAEAADIVPGLLLTLKPGQGFVLKVLDLDEAEYDRRRAE